MASHPTGGVKMMNIAGRMAFERERLIGMTDEERAWRAKFVKSQYLAPEEPVTPKGFHKEQYNPIRRFYKFPLDKVEAALKPVVGDFSAYVIRTTTGKLLMTITGVYSLWYYVKYNRATWMRKSGWKVHTSRETMFPGDKNFPNYTVKKPNQFATHSFEKSPI